jgi:hypothetical protein
MDAQEIIKTTYLQQEKTMPDLQEDCAHASSLFRPSQAQPKKNKEELKIYIYYDFECSQENGMHTSNLCVAEHVCQHCDSLDIDTPCNH